MKSLVCTALALVISGSAWAQEENEKPYFDMDHCTICKCMSKMKDDMVKIKWETRMIDNGFMTVTLVPDSIKGKWDTCHKSMEDMIKRLDSGEQMELCGFCTDFGSLMEAGAKKQELEAAGVKIMMFTSDDPSVVKKIKAMGEKMVAEHKKMKQMMEKMMQEQKG